MRDSIIHMKLPTNEYGTLQMSHDKVKTIYESVRDTLPADYILIATPFEITEVTGDEKVVNIDCKEYSYNELKAIIDKAWMYDELNK